jgi:hypothetical protein
MADIDKYECFLLSTSQRDQVKAGLAIFGLWSVSVLISMLLFVIIKFTIRHKISKILHGDGRIKVIDKYIGIN